MQEHHIPSTLSPLNAGKLIAEQDGNDLSAVSTPEFDTNPDQSNEHRGALVVVAGDADLANTETFSLKVEIRERDVVGSGDWGDYEELLAATVIAKGDTTDGTTDIGYTLSVPVDLRGRKKAAEIRVTPTASRSNAADKLRGAIAVIATNSRTPGVSVAGQL